LTKKLAVILFNLGGPSDLGSVEPFLFNLFNDPAIIGIPQPMRWALAKWVSKKRAPVARKIYQNIGGKSPLLSFTQKQASALESILGENARVFISMRYWHPMSEDVVGEVLRFAPDEIVLLPLYPQFSTTTTRSSLMDWKKEAKKQGLSVPTATVCCYPTEPGFIDAQADLIREASGKAFQTGHYKILFSAHGIPKSRVEKGDPYQSQVEQTAEAIAKKLSISKANWMVCYQSKVGPLKWTGPSLAEALQEVSQKGVAAIVVPISFVSEHAETLVELDITYRKMAEDLNIPDYIRIPTVGEKGVFIQGLTNLISAARG
jgi:protoporphyrin/coproporphyrin ferrochelatase